MNINFLKDGRWLVEFREFIDNFHSVIFFGANGLGFEDMGGGTPSESALDL
jgi:hypothetical protein